MSSDSDMESVALSEVASEMEPEPNPDMDFQSPPLSSSLQPPSVQPSPKRRALLDRLANARGGRGKIKKIEISGGKKTGTQQGAQSNVNPQTYPLLKDHDDSVNDRTPSTARKEPVVKKTGKRRVSNTYKPTTANDHAAEDVSKASHGSTAPRSEITKGRTGRFKKIQVQPALSSGNTENAGNGVLTQARPSGDVNEQQPSGLVHPVNSPKTTSPRGTSKKPKSVTKKSNQRKRKNASNIGKPVVELDELSPNSSKKASVGNSDVVLLDLTQDGSNSTKRKLKKARIEASPSKVGSKTQVKAKGKQSVDKVVSRISQEKLGKLKQIEENGVPSTTEDSAVPLPAVPKRIRSRIRKNQKSGEAKSMSSPTPNPVEPESGVPLEQKAPIVKQPALPEKKGRALRKKKVKHIVSSRGLPSEAEKLASPEKKKTGVDTETRRLLEVKNVSPSGQEGDSFGQKHISEPPTPHSVAALPEEEVQTKPSEAEKSNDVEMTDAPGPTASSAIEESTKDKHLPLEEGKLIGSEVKEAGSEVKEAGSEVKEVGSEVKEVGSEVKEVGSEVKEVGSEVKEVDSEVKEVGSEGKQIDGEEMQIDSGEKVGSARSAPSNRVQNIQSAKSSSRRSTRRKSLTHEEGISRLSSVVDELQHYCETHIQNQHRVCDQLMPINSKYAAEIASFVAKESLSYNFTADDKKAFADSTFRDAVTQAKLTFQSKQRAAVSDLVKNLIGAVKDWKDSKNVILRDIIPEDLRPKAHVRFRDEKVSGRTELKGVASSKQAAKIMEYMKNDNDRLMQISEDGQGAVAEGDNNPKSMDLFADGLTQSEEAEKIGMKDAESGRQVRTELFEEIPKMANANDLKNYVGSSYINSGFDCYRTRAIMKLCGNGRGRKIQEMYEKTPMGIRYLRKKINDLLKEGYLLSKADIDDSGKACVVYHTASHIFEDSN